MNNYYRRKNGRFHKILTELTNSQDLKAPNRDNEITYTCKPNIFLYNMQSNQSKLLISALVAAKAASALDIQDSTALVEKHQDEGLKNFLAQVNDDQGDDDDPPPGNGNDDSDAAPEPVTFANDPDAINDKIDLLTEAALGGLFSKSDWILNELTMYGKTREAELAKIDKECREKVEGLKGTL